MNPYHLSLAQLEQALPLLKERESLQSQLEKIEQQLRQIENGAASPPASPSHSESAAAAAVTKRSRRRKNIQRAILKVLKKSGPEGLKVKELAFRAKVKATSLRTWLYTTGKTVKEIEPKGDGLFSYKSD